MSAGYSGTPLPKKLGIKDDSRVVILNAPDGFEIEGDEHVGDHADVILLFTTQRAELEHRLPELQQAIFPAGGLWICWPKKASKVPTDITEDTVRDVALPGGRLVDNKVCAIDAIWSGLRLVIRKEKRLT